MRLPRAGVERALLGAMWFRPLLARQYGKRDRFGDDDNFPGVRQVGKRFSAMITVAGKNFSLGTFSTQREACVELTESRDKLIYILEQKARQNGELN